mmetsp:Transcript_10373/g.11775  ORF Transcript_10373/g.11775 Transcript_10373/m.11775 type:complete len:246 (-) Transcript_10373:1027-1764(-)
MSDEIKESDVKKAKIDTYGSDSAKPKLYSYWRSSCSWRVRLALELKDLEYEIIPVHLVKNGGEQKSGDYATVNPMQQVPTLIMKGNALTQSVAIIEYLEEAADSKTKLLCEDPILRAKTRALVELINSGIQPIQNLAVLNHLKCVANVSEDAKPKVAVDWSNHFISVGFEALEKELVKIHEKTPGDYCMGENISMADIYLVPQVYNANRFKVDMSKFPMIQKIANHLSALPAFMKAHPDAQPDAE